MKRGESVVQERRVRNMPSDRTIRATFKRLGLPANAPARYPVEESYSKDYKRCSAFELQDVSYSAHAGV